MEHQHMTFEAALALIRRGHRMTRAAWAGGDLVRFVYLEEAEHPSLTPILYLTTLDGDDGYREPWMIGQDCVLTNDWMPHVDGGVE